MVTYRPMTRPEDLLVEYRALKRAQRQVMERLRKRISKRAFGECARTLTARRTKALEFENPRVVRVVMEYSVFEGRRGGKGAVDRYLAAAAPPEESDERLVLEAMQRAHYSIFGVDEVYGELGVQVKDLLQHESIVLADEALARGRGAGFAMAGRILRFDEFAMSTGAMLLLPREVMEHVGEPLGRFLKGRGETEPADLSAGEKNELAVLLIRACLVMNHVELMDTDPWPKGA